MKKPAKIVFRVLLAVALVLTVVLVRVVKTIDVDRYKDQVVAWVGYETGRQVNFEGPLSFRMSLHPALVAENVTLANPAGAIRPEMIKLDHVEAEIGLMPLLWGEVRAERIVVDGADLLLAQDGQGRGNWEFSGASSGEPAPGLPAAVIRVTQLAVRNLVVHVQDPAAQSLLIDRATLDADGLASPVALTLDGQWNGRKLAVTGLLGSLKDLFMDEKPLAVRLKLLAPGVVASAEGTVRTQREQGLVVALAMSTELKDSADLDPLIGLPLPSLGSARGVFTLAGPLSRPALTSIEATAGRHDVLAISIKGAILDPLAGTGIDLALGIDGDASAAFGFGSPGKTMPMSLSGHVAASGNGGDKSWKIADLKGTLGRSDLSGQFAVGHRNGHSVIDAQFDSSLLDLTRPPQPASADTGPTPMSDGRVFPDDPLPTQMLAESDGHFVWRVQRLIDRRLSVGASAVDITWRDGKLTALANVSAVAGGRVDGVLSVDAHPGPVSMAMDLTVAHVQIGDFLTALGLSNNVQGARVDLKLKTAGTGSSLRSLMASQQGTSLLSVGPMQLVNHLPEDGYGAILARLGAVSGDRADIRCLVSHFTMADGLARSEALLLAIGTQTVTGQGSVALGTETLDFTLTPRPAGQPPTSQLDVGGTLLHPSVAVDHGAIVKNVPGIAGEAASPLMSFATDGGNPCFATLAQGRRPTRAAAGGAR